MFNHAYMWFSYVTSALFFVYLLYKLALAQKNKPVVARADVVYQEWFASGHSKANILTRLGGARNCVRLIVTADHLIVTSWFPFLLFSAFYDLEHVIPLKAILPIEGKRTFGVNYLLLAYQDDQGRIHKISLIPKNQEGFLGVLGHTENPASR